jgi:hypothetical protein
MGLAVTCAGGLGEGCAGGALVGTDAESAEVVGTAERAEVGADAVETERAEDVGANVADVELADAGREVAGLEVVEVMSSSRGEGVSFVVEEVDFVVDETDFVAGFVVEAAGFVMEAAGFDAGILGGGFVE